MTREEIREARQMLEAERRVVLEELTRKQAPERRRLQEACDKLGHSWRFTHIGPVGGAWHACPSCGATKFEA